MVKGKSTKDKPHDEEIQVNPRISIPTHKELAKLARSKNISHNKMAANLIQIAINLVTNKCNNICMHTGVLGLLLGIEKDADYEINAKKAAKLVYSKMNHQVFKLDPRELKRRLEEWHEFNNFNVNQLKKGLEITYKIEHKCGPKFSRFQVLLYKELLSMVKITVLHTAHDEFGYEITIMDPYPEDD
jgi:hypothetical protein